MELKTCSTCKIEKPLDSFLRGDRYRGGYRSQCKDCGREYRQRWRESRKEMVIDVPDFATCGSCGGEKPAADFVPTPMTTNGLNSYCKDCNRTYQREWARRQRESNPEFQARQRRAGQSYRQRVNSDPERRERRTEPARLYGRRWYAAAKANPEMKAKRAAYYQRVRNTPEHKLSRRLNVGAYRARKVNAGVETITRQQWNDIVAQFGGSCAYCGDSSRTLEIDHIIPIGRGGHHEVGNIVPACRSCNRKKGKQTPEQAGMAIEERYDVSSDDRKKRAA